MDCELSGRFVRGLAAQDATALKEVMAPRVNFRALTPGSVWEGDDRDAVVDEVILGTWFSADRAVADVLAVDCTRVGPVERVGYRFRVQFPDGLCLIEQQAYFRTDGDQIEWLRILCSGFVDA